MCQLINYDWNISRGPPFKASYGVWWKAEPGRPMISVHIEVKDRSLLSDDNAMLKSFTDGDIYEYTRT